MIRKKKIGVLFGGYSSEHEISLKSAYGIISHIDREKYQPVLIGITREGKWYLFRGDEKKIDAGTWHLDKSCIPAVISPDRIAGGVVYTEKGEHKCIRLDAALPVLHGKAGEDGTVQGLLELAGIPLIGCGTMSSAVCMDKDMSHKLAEAAGIKVPSSYALICESDTDGAILWAEKTGYPIFVKPNEEGSSIGMSKVFDQEQLGEAIKTAFQFGSKVLLEETIEGFEVGCSVLGNQELILGTVDEIEVPGGFFDFKEKYTQKNSQIYVPARIPEHKAKEIQQASKVIYRALGCKGFARVDLFLTPKGDIVFNEVNTIPGFTVHSRYPNMLKHIGLTYDEMVEKLIQTEVGA